MDNDTPKEVLKEAPKATSKGVIQEPPKVIIKETPKATPKESPKEQPIARYKMNLYTRNGLLRPEIHRGTVAIMSARYGDIIRTVSLNHWSTMADIFVSYKNLAKRLHFEPVMTNKNIEMAIQELVEAGMVEVR